MNEKDVIPVDATQEAVNATVAIPATTSAKTTPPTVDEKSGMATDAELVEALRVATRYALKTARGFRIDAGDAEEIANVCTFEAYRKWRRDAKATLSTWACHRVKFAILDKRRHENRYSTVAFDELAANLVAPGAAGSPADFNLNQESAPGKIEAAAAGASTRQLMKQFKITNHEARNLRHRHNPNASKKAVHPLAANARERENARRRNRWASASNPQSDASAAATQPAPVNDAIDTNANPSSSSSVAA